jgi:lysylphosphatidylglycerol synthetase-like protein (DUF2156 family)
MSERSVIIESYLDDLLAALVGEAGAVRRMLTETEAHLYADLDSGMARGLGLDDAARAAILHFGPAPRVAHEWSASAPPKPMPPLPTMLRRGATQLAPLLGVGLVAIGISGLLARAMTALWGLRFMFADPPGTTYPAASCSHWMSLHPRAATCTSAYLAESLSDGLDARYAAGLLGIAVLAVLAIRRWRRQMSLISLPSPTTALVAAGLFCAATVALAALATDAIRVAHGNGTGQWLSAAIVTLLVAVSYGLAYLRSIHRRLVL